MQEIDTIVEEIPVNIDHWLLACRMGNNWTISCAMQTSKEAVLQNDLPCWSNYDEYKLVKISLPVIVPKKVEEPKEVEPNPLQGMVEI